MRVSAIIVSYRHGAALGRTLRSLSHLGDALHEVIVIDNAGDLGDLPFETVAGIPPRLVEPGENLGFSVAVNWAAREAGGEVLMLLSPDAEIAGWQGSRLLSDFEGDTGAIGALTLDREDRPALSWGEFAGARAVWQRLIQLRPVRRREVFARLARGLSVPVEWVLGAALLISKAHFDVIGGLDPAYFSSGEDQDLGARLQGKGLRTIVSPGWVVRHVPRDPKGFRGEIRANNRRFVARYGTPLDRAIWSLADVPAAVVAGVRGERAS